MCTTTVSSRGTAPVDTSARGEDLYLAIRGDLYLATSGDTNLATRGDFFMATDIVSTWRQFLDTASRLRTGVDASAVRRPESVARPWQRVAGCQCGGMRLFIVMPTRVHVAGRRKVPTARPAGEKH